MTERSPNAPLSPYVIIVGFGVPGRAVAEYLHLRGTEYCVIERNEEVVSRCARTGVPIISGNALDESAMKEAELHRATLVVIAIPDEHQAIEVTKMVRGLNATVHIVTRCHFISVGLEARTIGANTVVIAEEAVARDLRAAIVPLIDPQP